MQMHEDILAKMSMHNRQHGYGILDERYHGGQSGREYFAGNPGGEWVNLFARSDPRSSLGALQV